MACDGLRRKAQICDRGNIGAVAPTVCLSSDSAAAVKAKARRARNRSKCKRSLISCTMDIAIGDSYTCIFQSKPAQTTDCRAYQIVVIDETELNRFRIGQSRTEYVRVRVP